MNNCGRKKLSNLSKSIIAIGGGITAVLIADYGMDSYSLNHLGQDAISSYENVRWVTRTSGYGSIIFGSLATAFYGLERLMKRNN